MFGPREECGVFGIYSKSPCAGDIYHGLSALQHRGQESCGIAMVHHDELDVVKGMGLVGKVFDAENVSDLKGNMGIGHIRYSTAGESKLPNAQPFLTKSADIKFAIAHNGNLVNFWQLKEHWTDRGHIFTTSADTEVISKILVNEYMKEKNFMQAIKNTARYLDGAYSLLIMTPDALYAVRDPFGFRPLLMCDLPNGYAFASEDCAFNTLPSKLIRDIKPGEIVKVSADGIETDRMPKINRRAHCMFEYVYFARPDSTLNGVSVYKARKTLGKLMAKSYPIKADIVSAVPYSGVASAIGYSQESGIPYTEILLRNRYAGRSFIMPSQESRDLMVKMKLIPVEEEIRGKEIVLIDDSIVRGTTMKQIVALIRAAGAKKIHLRITCPPIIAPCFYGVDMQQYKQFIAVEKTIKEIGEFIGADSIEYNTIDNLVEAIGLPKNNLCMACINEDYPTELGELRAKQTKLTELNGTD
jgi:amidophosphoribosyltransferase